MEDYGYVHNILENVISHSVVVSPIFILNNAEQMEGFRGCWAVERKKKKKGGNTFAVFVIQNQASLFVCKLTIPYSTQLRWDHIILSQSITAEDQ